MAAADGTAVAKKASSVVFRFVFIAQRVLCCLYCHRTRKQLNRTNLALTADPAPPVLKFVAPAPPAIAAVLPCGIVYDERMVEHKDVTGCEVGQRVVEIAKQLRREGLLGGDHANGTLLVPARTATDRELLVCVCACLLCRRRIEAGAGEGVVRVQARVCVGSDRTCGRVPAP